MTKLPLLVSAAFAALLTIAPAQAQAQATMTASLWVPPAHPLNANIFVPWLKEVEAATQGRVMFNILPKAPVAPPQTFDAVKDGVTDVSITVQGYTPGRFVLTKMAEFDFLGNSAEATSVAYERIYKRDLAKFNEHKGVKVQVTALGSKSAGLLSRVSANLVSQEVQLGDAPNLERLIGAVKVQIDAFVDGKIDAVYLATNRFVNTMKQDPSFIRLLPLPSVLADPFQTEGAASEDVQNVVQSTFGWDYLYEPDARTVIDELLMRYVEGLVYQAVAENMASEQSARMVAMKAASDNAKKVISDLQLVYNKTRQAAITKEISEIVGGAAAV